MSEASAREIVISRSYYTYKYQHLWTEDDHQLLVRALNEQAPPALPNNGRIYVLLTIPNIQTDGEQSNARLRAAIGRMAYTTVEALKADCPPTIKWKEALSRDTGEIAFYHAGGDEMVFVIFPVQLSFSGI